MSLLPPGINMSFVTKGGGGGTGITGVLSKSYQAPPPGTPVSGDSYIVKVPGTGVWTGYDNAIAVWDGANWVFTAPTLGQLVYVADEGLYYTWDGSQWVLQTLAAHGSTHEQGSTDPVPSLPTTSEKDALLGTYGTPSITNRYVTDSDPRLSGGGGGGGGSCGCNCVEETYNDNAWHTIATIPILDNQVTIIDAKVVGRRTDTAGRCAFLRRAVVYREGGVATLQGTVDTPLTRKTVSSWNVTIDVSGNNAIIKVRGSTGATMHWRACWTLTCVGTGYVTSDGAYHVAETIAVPDDTIYLLEVAAVARRTDFPGRGGYLRKAVVYREGGGNATLQGVVNSPFTRETTSAWDVTVDVSGTDIQIKVRGAAGQTVNWRFAYTLEEVS